MNFDVDLPWPPSINHYYRHVGPRVLISKDGKRYRLAVGARLRLANIKPFDGAVRMDIELYPPDERRRDIDNTLKCLLDVLTDGGVYRDDSQVKKLTVEKKQAEPPFGRVRIRIANYEKT